MLPNDHWEAQCKNHILLFWEKVSNIFGTLMITILASAKSSLCLAGHECVNLVKISMNFIQLHHAINVNIISRRPSQFFRSKISSPSTYSLLSLLYTEKSHISPSLEFFLYAIKLHPRAWYVPFSVQGAIKIENIFYLISAQFAHSLWCIKLSIIVKSIPEVVKHSYRNGI